MSAIAELEAQLREMVAARLRAPPQSVPLDADIVAELGLESLEVMTFLLDVENRYPPVAFDALQASNVRTLRELAAYIAQLQGR